ncbi:MAG: response regulator [Patescibacteria group bacterium]|nr:response regulator [Patescibacteria group bacterium]
MYFLQLPISKRREIARGVAEVTFEFDGNAFDFEPGQYVRIVLSELKAPDARGASRDFSIASLPNGKNIVIVFRSDSKKLSGFKQTLLSLPIGEKVTVLGPHGTLTLPSVPSIPLIFIAGGIGITAFASKIQYALANEQNRRITLLWSTSHPTQEPFLSELRQLARKHKKNFTFLEIFGGRIETKVLKKYVRKSDGEHPLWQLAGPPDMVVSVRAMLADLKVKDVDISYEEYEGYGSSPKPHHVDSAIASIKNLDKAAHLSAPPFEGLLEVLDKTAIVSKTDADGTIVFVNDKFVEVSKYSREELIGQNHRILKSGHHPAEFYRELWHAISSGHIWRGEIKNRAKDGSYYWVDTSIAPIMGENGAPERYVSVRFVITDKKKAEEELATYRGNLEKLVEERTNELSTVNEKLKAHAAELAESDRKKDEFIAVLSHELRNPLSPDISSMELIEMQGANHPSTLGIVEMAHTHLKIVARLLDDLLDVSRITRKKFKLQKETIAIQTILRRAIESVMPFAQNKQHQLSLSMPEEPVWIQADPLRLSQIFVNVLSNALKYTRTGGVIKMRCVQEGKSVAVSIKDNGIGIPKDMRDKIFEMFVQGKTTTTVGTGLGIGLSLAKRLVEMHNGTIEVLSEGENKGSEFVIRLPVPRAVQLPMQAPVPAHQKLEKRFRILIVDDNESAAKSLGMLLERRGHRVALAYGWRTALIEAANGYDVILLDIGMPEVDGYDLARLIVREVASPPALIALTGYGQEEDKRRAREAGFVYHLTKPISVAEVEKMLMKIK